MSHALSRQPLYAVEATEIRAAAARAVRDAIDAILARPETRACPGRTYYYEQRRDRACAAIERALEDRFELLRAANPVPSCDGCDHGTIYWYDGRREACWRCDGTGAQVCAMCDEPAGVLDDDGRGLCAAHAGADARRVA